MLFSCLVTTMGTFQLKCKSGPTALRSTNCNFLLDIMYVIIIMLIVVSHPTIRIAFRPPCTGYSLALPNVSLITEGLPPFMTPWMRDRRLAAKAKPRTIRPDIISAVKKLDPNLSFPNYDEAAKRRWDRLVNSIGPAAKARWQEQFGDVPQTP
jgi:hypothetical protein